MEVVTERKPSEREWGEMLFAWKVCKHVRSNAIVLARGPGLGRDRRRPDEPRRLGQARDREGARATETDLAGARARLRRLLPVLRRPAAGGRRRRDARSSSPAAPSATTRSSRRPTPPASRWSSRTAATSSTEARQAERRRIEPVRRGTAGHGSRQHRTRPRRGRAAIGAALLAAPGEVARRWLGDVSERPGAQVAISRRRRARPGPRRSAPSGRSAAASVASRPWLIASGLADTVDLAGGAALPQGADPAGGGGTAAVAGGSAVLCAWLRVRARLSARRRGRATRSWPASPRSAPRALRRAPERAAAGSAPSST